MSGDEEEASQSSAQPVRAARPVAAPSESAPRISAAAEDGARASPSGSAQEPLPGAGSAEGSAAGAGAGAEGSESGGGTPSSAVGPAPSAPPPAAGGGGPAHLSRVTTPGGTGGAPENLLDVIDGTLLAEDTYEHQIVLCCLPASHPLRRLAIDLMRSPWFDRVIMSLILANCVQMAVQDPLMDTNSQRYVEWQAFNLYFDTGMITAFTVEMTVKILAMGFAFHRQAYLRDAWNWIDFVCVVSGLLDLVTNYVGGANGAGALTALRAVRVLRPLRTLTRMRGMRNLIACLLSSIPQLSNVVGILFFLLAIFGIIGVQLFQGKLRHQCWGPTDESAWGPTGDVCNPFGDPLTYSCPAPYECRCGVSGEVALDASGASRCKRSDNPNFGINHFDHFWGAFITIFQSITLEGWVDNMYMVQDGVNEYMWIYFLFIVTFGAFLVVQLFLVVLSDTFSSVSHDDARMEAEEKAEEEKAAAAHADGAGGAAAGSFKSEMPAEYTDEDGDGIMDLDVARMGWAQKHAYQIVTQPFFTTFILGMIVVNTITMCCEYFEQPEDEAFVFSIINFVLTAIFTVEIVLKLLAMGWANCMRDTFNRFDAIVVALSLVEVALQVAGAGVVNLAVLRTFRLLRLVRVFKVMRSLEGLHHVMQALLSSLRSVSSLAVLLLLLVVVFALLGMELFGGIYTPPPFGRNANYDGGESPRANFDGFGMSCLSIFIVLSGENWNEVYFDTANGLQTMYEQEGYREIATLYFLTLFLLGNYVVFNLFVAIILLNIDVVEEAEMTEEERAAKIDDSGKVVFAFGGLVQVADDVVDAIGDAASSSLSRLIQLNAKPLIADRGPVGDKSGRELRGGAGALFARSRTRGVKAVGSGADTPTKREMSGDMRRRTEDGGSFVWPEDSPADRSLFLFPWSHPVRRACALVVWHPMFDRMILALIFASSIALAFETPDKSAETEAALFILNWIFTVVFFVEMILKVVVLGFVAPKPTAYLRSAWNVLDFCIVVISCVLLALEYGDGLSTGQLSWLKALRVVRTLRPLRMVTRMAGMKQVVNSLIAAVPQCGNVAMLMCLFVLIFSIIGVQLFKGKFYSCTDERWLTAAECAANGGRWVNPPFGNFDNVGFGVLLLLEMAGLEGWPDVMFTGMAVTEEYHAPVRDDRDPKVAYSLYFVIWIFAGAFLVWNMFVGVVLDTFNQIRKKDDGAAFMSPAQRDWMEAQRAVYAMRPLKVAECPSASPLRQRVFKVIQAQWFEITIMCMILLNVIAMMLDWHDKPPDYAYALRIINYFFTIFFFLEMALKLTGLGVKQYITNAWNAFDALLVTVSMIDLLFELAGDLLVAPINPNILRVLRMFRVVRILRVVKTAKGLRTLLVTLWTSLPALQNVMLLLGLIMFIYAIAGMLMFHNVPFGDCLNRHANFRTFWMALLTLFRCSTGESWNCIMHDAMGAEWGDNAARCEGEVCGSTPLAAGYFLSYYIVGQAILLNLVIGVILENFSAIGSENKPITVEQLEEFREIWLRYDPKATYVIPSYQLLPLISQLSYPLGLGGRKPAASRAQLLKFMRKIDIPDHNGEIHFIETITAIANSICGVPLPICDETFKIAQQAEKVPKDPRSLGAPDNNAMTSYLVSLLQHRYRNYHAQKQWEMDINATGARAVESMDDVDASDFGRSTGTERSRSHQNSAAGAGMSGVTRFLSGSGSKSAQVVPARQTAGGS